MPWKGILGSQVFPHSSLVGLVAGTVFAHYYFTVLSYHRPKNNGAKGSRAETSGSVNYNFLSDR